MYCPKCGEKQDENAVFCQRCGTPLSGAEQQDKSSPAFAFLGFFFPLVGLILYAVYERKEPRRAKSALRGFIVRLVVIAVVVVIYITVGSAVLKNALDYVENSNVISQELLGEETTESTQEIMEKYLDVSLEKLNITNNGLYNEISLDVTLKNKSDRASSFSVTIAAVGKNGERIYDDTVYVGRLEPGQTIRMKAFKYSDPLNEKTEQFKTAEYKVIEAYREVL